MPVIPTFRRWHQGNQELSPAWVLQDLVSKPNEIKQQHPETPVMFGFGKIKMLNREGDMAGPSSLLALS